MLHAKVLSSVNLNTEQQEIINCDAANILVDAIAGSGKTLVLTNAISFFLQQENGNALFLTFSKSANANCEKRLADYAVDVTRVETKTLHSFGFTLIKEHYKLLGFKSRPSLKLDVCNDLYTHAYKKASKLHKQLVKITENKAIALVKGANNRCSDIRSHAMKLQDDYKLKLTDADVEALIAVKKAHRAMKKQFCVIDYRDQIYYCYRLLRDNPNLLASIAKKYSYLAIDEFQDLDQRQTELALLLIKAIKRSIVVGDEAQVIYGFRGVEPDNFDYYADCVTSAKRFSMSFTHRCSQQIADFLTHQRNLIKDVRNIRIRSKFKSDKPVYAECSTRKAQYDYIAKQIKILQRNGVKLSDIAVIGRQAAHLTQLQTTLTKNNIFFVSKFTEEYDLNEIIEALIIVFQLCESGYDHGLVTQYFDFLAIEDSIEHFRLIEESFTLKPSDKIKLHKDVKAFALLIYRLHKESDLESQTILIVDYFISLYKGSNKHYLISTLDFVLMYSRNVSSVESLVDAIKEKILNESITDAVNLITAHSSKSLEYKAVFIVDAAQGLFPDSRDDINDERKLFYVACSRASDYLYITAFVKEENCRSVFMDDIAINKLVKFIEI